MDYSVCVMHHRPVARLRWLTRPRVLGSCYLCVCVRLCVCVMYVCVCVCEFPAGGSDIAQQSAVHISFALNSLTLHLLCSSLPHLPPPPPPPPPPLCLPCSPSLSSSLNKCQASLSLSLSLPPLSLSRSLS